MKKLFLIIGLLFSTITIAHAEIPQATLNATISNDGQHHVSLTIPKNHHAYLDKGEEGAFIPISIDLEEKYNADFSLQNLQKPTGIYDHSVKATVLRDQGDFSFKIAQKNNSSQTLQLNVKYQLCDEEANVCFRPQTAEVDLALPIVKVEEKASTGFMDQIVQLFERNKNNTFIMFGLMFLAGLLSVATPCVYPMLPITAMFIVNRAGGVAKQEKYHAFVYWLGIIVTYMALGLMAGMTGGAFNIFMQSAIVNLLFAVLFGFFAIALLGFYDIAFLQSEVGSLDQKALKIKGLSGTFLIGTVAGLVISPCVGPIVFALLLQVADNIAEKAAALATLNQTLTLWDKLLISSQGSAMMAGFGLGVGLPFFLVGAIKFKKLPKAGYWMNKIKYAFGILILYLAYTYLEKGLGVLGVTHSTILYLVIGMIGVWVAIVHCEILTLLPEDALPPQKLQRFLGTISLLIGGWLLITSLGQFPLIQNVNASVKNTSISKTEATENLAGITWYRNFADAQKVAQQTGKPLFIDFYASWCANCLAFAQETSTNQALNQTLRNNAIAVKLVDQEPDFETFRGKSEHRQLKIGLPYFAILNPDGSTIWSGTDYQASEKMISVLKNQTK
jgi:thiol:disulfide interchange protein DsbD